MTSHEDSLAHRGAVPPDPTRQAAQRLLARLDSKDTFKLLSPWDVRLVAEAVMERNNQSIIGARSAENAEMCARGANDLMQKALRRAGELADEQERAEREWAHDLRLSSALVRDDARRRVGEHSEAEQLARDVVALQAEVVRLREALEGLVAWENYDVEYADEATIREHDADYARARAALKEAACL